MGVIGEHRGRVGRKRRGENLNRTQFVRIFSLEGGYGGGVGFSPFSCQSTVISGLKQFDLPLGESRGRGKYISNGIENGKG